ncbi:pro-sigmaK processing inhibitor BofA family protein [Papillibacter cinnamivorans]|uniref:Inhibitor of the pro-sigma K processing machinery n=1 Tax=Papillibacter cinnamivorans DSM 12816 TaxID=1122930 RepID=A0A1W2BH14_9FIRM|nr:pro-sigmaK processing inhibitor BofA family protein [Papillibacter cinnamivorans]SMC72219.1 inhibitor of the pro-sigma K processing machinery [Papillibacter cinnamivorans DSM 12816]
MEILQKALLFLFVVLAVVGVVRLFRTPLRIAAKIILNTILGFAGLILLNLAAPFTGIALGVNLFNAVVIGVLGLPGFALLLLVRWILLT